MCVWVRTCVGGRVSWAQNPHISIHLWSAYEAETGLWASLQSDRRWISEWLEVNSNSHPHVSDWRVERGVYKLCQTGCSTDIQFDNCSPTCGDTNTVAKCPYWHNHTRIHTTNGSKGHRLPDSVWPLSPCNQALLKQMHTYTSLSSVRQFNSHFCWRLYT